MVHFEIPADDVTRAQNFYHKAFGWTFNEFPMPENSSTGGEPYWGVITTPLGDDMMPQKAGEINGGLMKRTQAGQMITNYLHCPSIDETLETITQYGGEIIMPKTAIAPNMGWIALFKDTEGNILGLHEVPKETQ